MPRMTEQQRKDILLLQNSIERVINNTINNLERRINRLNEEESINLEDWLELKTLVVELFNNARNEAFKRANP